MRVLEEVETRRQIDGVEHVGFGRLMPRRPSALRLAASNCGGGNVRFVAARWPGDFCWGRLNDGRGLPEPLLGQGA